MKSFLEKNGFINPNSISRIANKVRDRDDVSVWKCLDTGIIFIDKPKNDIIEHYKTKQLDDDLNYSVTYANGVEEITLWQEDDKRRADTFRDMFRGKDWMDVGAGEGGLISILESSVRSAVALEVNEIQCKRMRTKGLHVETEIRDLNDESFDVISLFHVLEHVENPINELKEICRCLKKYGRLIVEVPHARDFLIHTLKSESFQDFTFWSEHLVLHTRQSLERLLRLAGLEVQWVQGVQRYHLANHMYWLKENMPGGHGTWNFIDTPEMKFAYENMLNLIDQTDTLTAVAIKKE